MPRPAHRRPRQGRAFVPARPALGRSAPAICRGVRPRGLGDRATAGLLIGLLRRFAVGGIGGLLLGVGFAGPLDGTFEFGEDLLDEILPRASRSFGPTVSFRPLGIRSMESPSGTSR